jgi:hypothetical protein
VTTEASQALTQALLAAARDSSHRPKALSALRGAEVWAATWPGDPGTLRTLTNSNGVTALAIFSTERQLEDAAVRYGWLGPDGHVPSRRLHISEAMRFAKYGRAQLVVVDIAADHSLELDEGEMELVSSLPSTRPPSYEGIGQVISKSRPPPDGAEVRRLSSRPPAFVYGSGKSSRPPQSGLKPSSVMPGSTAQAVSATFAAPSTATMRALDEVPSDALLAALAEVLRGYPEVEWACLVSADRGQTEGAASVALRIEPAFRKHLAELSVRLHDASSEHGRGLEVLMLDTPEQMKLARSIGLPFYPWRKEATRKVRK